MLLTGEYGTKMKTRCRTQKTYAPPRCPSLATCPAVGGALSGGRQMSMIKPKEIPPLSESDLARFWSKVDKSPGLGPDGDCWEWTACILSTGYGQFSAHGGCYSTHRVSFSLMIGPIPKGLCVLHRCDNRRCVNPSHLWAGTHADNGDDCTEKGRRLKGSSHQNSKLTERQVMDIRLAYCPYKITHRCLGKKYGVDASLVWQIVNYKIWKHI